MRSCCGSRSGSKARSRRLASSTGNRTLQRERDAEVARRLADRIALTYSLRGSPRQSDRRGSRSAPSGWRLRSRRSFAGGVPRTRPDRGHVAVMERFAARGRRVASSDTTGSSRGVRNRQGVISNLIHQDRHVGKAVRRPSLRGASGQLLESDCVGHERAPSRPMRRRSQGAEQSAADSVLDEIAEMSPIVRPSS